MKADLDEKGTLRITAESPVESFALTHWWTMWEKKEAALQVTTVARAEDGFLDRRQTNIEANLIKTEIARAKDPGRPVPHHGSGP